MKCKIETFSPVHIGTGEQIYPFDYVVDGEYYIRYLLENLVERYPSRVDDLAGKIEHFANRRESRGEQFSLNGFLTDEEIDIRENWEYSGFIELETTRLIIEQLSSGFQADIFEAIKTIQNELYIPGSSIKGSIRNAIAYSYLKKDNRLLHRVKEKISRWQKSRGKDDIGKVAIEELFRNSGEVKGIQSDILKAVSVSDTQTLSPDENLGICATKTVSIGERNNYKRWWSFYEVILEDRTLILDINLSENWLENQRAFELLGWNKFLGGKRIDFDFIINCCNDFAFDLINHEIDFYEKYNREELFNEALNFYDELKDKIETVENNECILRLGKGTGWTGITAVGLHLIKDERFDMNSYRKKTGLGKKYVNLFPKSRLIDAVKKRGDVELYWPLGWVILSFEGE